MARPLDRRSFLTQVMGVAALGGCATARVPARAPAAQSRMVVDADPSDPARPLPEPARPSSCSDSDAGPAADPANAGRRCGSRATGISDSDSGSNADPPQVGRGRMLGPSSYIVCPGHPRCPR